MMTGMCGQQETNVCTDGKSQFVTAEVLDYKPYPSWSPTREVRFPQARHSRFSDSATTHLRSIDAKLSVPQYEHQLQMQDTMMDTLSKHLAATYKENLSMRALLTLATTRAEIAELNLQNASMEAQAGEARAQWLENKLDQVTAEAAGLREGVSSLQERVAFISHSAEKKAAENQRSLYKILGLAAAAELRACLAAAEVHRLAIMLQSIDGDHRRVSNKRAQVKDHRRVSNERAQVKDQASFSKSNSSPTPSQGQRLVSAICSKIEQASRSASQTGSSSDHELSQTSLFCNARKKEAMNEEDEGNTTIVQGANPAAQQLVPPMQLEDVVGKQQQRNVSAGNIGKQQQRNVSAGNTQGIDDRDEGVQIMDTSSRGLYSAQSFTLCAPICSASPTPIANVNEKRVSLGGCETTKAALDAASVHEHEYPVSSGFPSLTILLGGDEDFTDSMLLDGKASRSPLRSIDGGVKFRKSCQAVADQLTQHSNVGSALQNQEADVLPQTNGSSSGAFLLKKAFQCFFCGADDI
ncbi:hypothetical protein CEUSTIGMA_g2184.t1 [Chlamydomonas eustigma]|uniref:Uncharacterized protein n=1 Tax=Chlamydomonas eustigma TaxID=1157962 RepID=A0A250WV74_9CHLO|nr:hypothetical protein CEUSTIGMA_g2184.t1 [Chlamydomonas eustigma]|eukprot:GAX74737.1 hypothetical protein CEUSTIGMA_g2184.t1 [Chlamydomonas eustigma]